MALLRYNAHTIKFTHFKKYISGFQYIHRAVQPSPNQSEDISSPQKETQCPLTITPPSQLPSLPVVPQPLPPANHSTSCFFKLTYSGHFFINEIYNMWLSCLASSMLHVFQAYPPCSTYQYFIPLYGLSGNIPNNTLQLAIFMHPLKDTWFASTL